MGEAPNFREVIASEVMEIDQKLLLEFFTQIRTELLETMTYRIISDTQ